MSDKTPCFTLVADEGDLGYQTQDLRAALEKGTDDLKLDTLRRIIVSTLNGQPQVRVVLTRPSQARLWHPCTRPSCGRRTTDATWSLPPSPPGWPTLHTQPALLMPIIQFVLPSKSKQIKKLLQCVLLPPTLARAVLDLSSPPHRAGSTGRSAPSTTRTASSSRR